MSEQKHTKGPWLVKFDGFDESLHITSQQRLEDDRVEIAQISVGYNDAFEAEQQANARLIAAAPDMLEALRGLLQQNEEFCQRTGLGDTDQMEAARAAISKALNEAMR